MVVFKGSKFSGPLLLEKPEDVELQFVIAPADALIKLPHQFPGNIPERVPQPKLYALSAVTTALTFTFC